MPDQDIGDGKHAGRSVHGSIDGGVGNVHLHAEATGEAEVYQAGGDQRIEQHHHYQDGVRSVRRTESDSVVDCPYPGLVAFGREQARWFFGRDQLSAELTAGLDTRLRTGGVQVVVAPSGAGKSSLLHAGLLAQIDAGALPGSRDWPQLVFTPTAHPLTALASQIASLADYDYDPTLLASRLETDPGQAVAALREVLRAHAGDEHLSARVVVVVDQFEELFTLCGNEQYRRAFVEVLCQMASSSNSTDDDGLPVGLVVVAVRADFYAACSNYPRLRSALQDRLGFHQTVQMCVRDGVHPVAQPQFGQHARNVGFDGLVADVEKSTAVRQVRPSGSSP